MCTNHIRYSSMRSYKAGLLGLVLLGYFSFSAAAVDENVITFTQTPCQFVESENGIDHRYQSTKKADCEVINGKTAAQRLQKSKTLKLKPGKYNFKVTNKNVPYNLGFWLRGDGLINRARLPSVSGGGLSMGMTKNYHVNLTPGEYIYSCPLNNTPDYKLIVTQ